MVLAHYTKEGWQSRGRKESARDSAFICCILTLVMCWHTTDARLMLRTKEAFLCQQHKAEDSCDLSTRVRALPAGWLLLTLNS
jgi:hypothetical protein